MKGFQVTLFILAIVCLSAQTIHYGYKKYIRSTYSVLDTATDRLIRHTQTLEALVREYKAKDKQLSAIVKGRTPAELRRMGHYRSELYTSHNKLRIAIRQWETRLEQLRKLKAHWIAGLLVFLLGIFLYWRKLPWQGMAFIAAGVLELIWWSSPSFRVTGPIAGYQEALNTKLLLTLITLALIVLTWNLRKRLSEA